MGFRSRPPKTAAPKYINHECEETMKKFLPVVLGLALCLPMVGFAVIPNSRAEEKGGGLEAHKVDSKREDNKKGNALTDHLLNVSVTIVSQSENRFARGGEGSGVIKTRKRGKETITFVWTAAHVVENLRHVKTVIDSKTGTPRTIAEFDWAKVVRSTVQNGETVAKSEMVVEVVRYSAEEDLALLRVRMKNFTNDSVQFYLDEKIPGVRTKLVHVGSLLGQLGSNSTTDGSMAFVGRMLNKKVYDQTTVTAFPGSSGGGVYLDDDGRLVGLILRGAGETFNLMVPVRRMRAWAKAANIEWALDDRVALPTDDELKKLPVEDTGLSFSYSAASSDKGGKTVSYGMGTTPYLGADESRYPTLFRLNPEKAEVLKMPAASKD
jgi:hypothetical protein